MGRLRSKRRNHNNDESPEKSRVVKKPFEIKTIEPLTNAQSETFNEYEKNQNLLLIGSPGTGKTFLSLYLALNEVINTKSQYKKVVIVRSVVPTREMGFLPGNLKEKIKVYEAPYYGICSELFGRDDAYDILKQKNLIEFISTSHVRGITIKNSIVIVDEGQNLSAHESDSIITRLHKTSKIIFCGDLKQTDFTKHSDRQGFIDFIRILNKLHQFSNINFTYDDIVRGSLIKDYIIAKESLDI